MTQQPHEKAIDKPAQSLLFSEPVSETNTLEHNWRTHFPEIVGHSKVLMDVLKNAVRIAQSDVVVLITGESGTGKELMAAAMHRLSPRAHKPFIALNCSAIPESLLESELFGHEKGAFTGAVSRRAGYLEMAEGGTLFLDEIGEMPLRIQAKLLRVLQEKQYTSVGGRQLKQANVRIISATNVDLKDAVDKQLFRLDLFYRLNVLPITLPPLRERREDIPELIDYFLNIANKTHKLENPCFMSRQALDVLCQYDWPGNIRELQNLIERLVVISQGGEILCEHLPDEFKKISTLNPPAPKQSPLNRHHIMPVKQITYPHNFGDLPEDGIDLPAYIEQIENRLILQALQRTYNNKNQAAKLLGLNRTTLVERIKKRKLQLPNESN